MQKSGKSYMIENTPDDVLNILRLGCKNSAVKAFLSDSSLKLNIFVKSGDIYEQSENFHIFATSVS